MSSSPLFKRGVAKALLICGLLFLSLLFEVQLRYVNRMFQTSDSVPPSGVGMILGASVFRNGTPTPALRDRLDVGIELLREQKVARLFLTGDDGNYHQDEMSVMTRYARAQGVSEEQLLIDGKGYRTYESCKHAKELRLSRVVIITQRFHLGRALYLCNRLGVDAVGFPANRTPYSSRFFFWAREIPASLKAWFDINLRAPSAPSSYGS